MFYKIGIFKIFETFLGKHFCQNPFFDEVVGVNPATLLEKWNSETGVFL